MSAWIVTKAHIDLLVQGIGLHSDVIDLAGYPDRDSNGLGRMLWLENLRSVGYRYPCEPVETLPGPVGLQLSDVLHYIYLPPAYTPTRAELANVVCCYRYQSCEHPEWRTSEAHWLTMQLERELEDVEPSGPWGWDYSDIEAASAANGEPA